MQTCEDGCNGCDDCTDYYDDGDFGGPTPEEWAWLDANARGASDKLRERIADLEKGLNEWRELALSQAGDAGIVARMVKAETEVSLLHAAIREEMDEGLRLRELGGALPDENITAMTERLIKERLNLAAMLRQCAHALRNRGREDLAADVVGLLRCYDLLGSPLRDGQP